MNCPLIEHNRLVKLESDIYVQDAREKSILNSHPETDPVDKFLKDVLRSARDLSSTSVELDSKYIYWSTEYYLSSMRANLIRALDLSGVRSVLEIGSGGGAITRYLGDLGLHVDAVEENQTKAEIAKIRCRDLNDVHVVNLNLRELDIHHSAYDAVFMIGVLECARRFLPDTADDKEAVIKMLSHASTALKKEGVLFIAIENRMGLKYWMGASEDHYGQPYVGLNGPPKNQRLRTYDQNEWKDLLEKAGIQFHRFIYPFPDHKLATVILSDHYIKNDKFAHSLLYKIKSRDYTNDWRPDSDEFLRWEALHSSGYLETFANSFCIVIANNAKRLETIFPYDFIWFSNRQRKLAYRLITSKLKGSSYVTKKSLVEQEGPNDVYFLDHHSKSNYLKGPLLSSLWLNAFKDANPSSAFTDLIKVYYKFLLKYFKTEEAKKPLDLLPFNIIVDSSGAYQVFDLEWQTTDDLNPEYILFRSLLWFCYIYDTFLNSFCEKRKITNILEFIEYNFRRLQFRLEEQLDKFIILEEHLQRHIDLHKGPDAVRSMILQPFQYVSTIVQSKTFAAQLYWVGENNALCSENSLVVTAPLGVELQSLFFRLPPQAKSIQFLRFDPAMRSGFFHLYHVALKWCDPEGHREEVLWELSGGENIANYAIMEGVHFCSAGMGNVFISTCDDPQIIFELPANLKARPEEGTFLFLVKMDWPKSVDHLILVDTIARKSLQIKSKEAKIIEQEVQLKEKNTQIIDLIDQVKERDAKIHIQAFKLNLIKQSGLGKIFKTLKRVLN